MVTHAHNEGIGHTTIYVKLNWQSELGVNISNDGDIFGKRSSQ